ncbi:MAG: hypothetical protein WCH46_04320 [bacterium]
MKKNRFSTLAIALLLLVTIPTITMAQAQDTLPYKAYEFGLFGTAGASIFNGTLPDGSKTDLHFAYTLGVLGTVAASHDFGFSLGIGAETRGMFFKEQGKTEPNQTITLNYLSIQPGLRFKSFLVGINIGMPLSGKVDYVTGLPSPLPASYSSDIGKDTLNTVIDIRLAGLLPIVENDFGNLYFMMEVSYPLSDAIGKGGFFTPGQTSITPVTKSPIPTVQIGFSYLFSPGAKTK